MLLFNCLVLSDSFATPWTVAHQALSMGFPRQKYLSGLSFPSSGNLPGPWVEPTTPAQAGGLFTTEPPEKPTNGECLMLIPGANIIIST